MIEKDADEIALETEETNTAAMKLYERLGFSEVRNFTDII